MHISKFLSAAIGAAIVFAASASAMAQQKLLPAQSEIVFVSKQMGVPVEGRFEERLMNVRDVLAVHPGVVIPLHRAAGETLRVYVGNVHIASAEVIVIEDHLALRITEFERLDA